MNEKDILEFHAKREFAERSVSELGQRLEAEWLACELGERFRHESYLESREELQQEVRKLLGQLMVIVEVYGEINTAVEIEKILVALFGRMSGFRPLLQYSVLSGMKGVSK